MSRSILSKRRGQRLRGKLRAAEARPDFVGRTTWEDMQRVDDDLIDFEHMIACKRDEAAAMAATSRLHSRKQGRWP
jgi:hypothetical protein